MFCPHCGNQVDDDAVFCTKCGARFERPATDTVTGSQSVSGQPENNFNGQSAASENAGGGENPGNGGYVYTPNSNYRPPEPPKKSSKSKLAAGLLGSFLGAYGVHNFYLGKTSRGVAQIIVTLVTCGVGGIWGLIEGILCLCGQYTDVDGLPLSD